MSDTTKLAFAKSAPATDENEPKGSESQGQAENMAERSSPESGANQQAADLEAAENATGQVGTDSDAAVYSSHPIENFHVAGFQFEKGTLKLTDSDEIERFEKLIESLPPRERSTIRKIDLDGAAAVAKRFNNASTSKRGIDTTGSDASA